MPQLTQLDNGVRIVTKKLKERESVSVGVWIGAGGRYEDDTNKGVAHFLEHMVFRGSKAYSCDDIKQRIEGVGGALNAFTSEEQTCYYAKVPSKFLGLTLDILVDMVVFPKLIQRDIERERGIILEEIKMYRDLPQYHVMDVLEHMMWPDHPLGENLAGTLESVRDMTKGQLKAFHRLFYNPRNIVITVCGDVAHDKLIPVLSKKLNTIKSLEKRKPQLFTGQASGPQLCIEKRVSEQTHVALGVHGFDAFHEDRYALAVLNTLLGGNMSSWLFDRVREKKGLAYSISSSSRSLSDTGMVYVRAGVDQQMLVPALTLIFSILKDIKRKKISPQELQRAKDYFLGQFALSLEDTMDHMLWMGEGVVTKNKIPEMAQVTKKIKRVTIHDLQRVAAMLFDPKRYHLAVVGPVQTKQEMDIKTLLAC